MLQQSNLEYSASTWCNINLKQVFETSHRIIFIMREMDTPP